MDEEQTNHFTSDYIKFEKEQQKYFEQYVPSAPGKEEWDKIRPLKKYKGLFNITQFFVSQPMFQAVFYFMGMGINFYSKCVILLFFTY